MYFKPLGVVSIAAILSTTSAAPALLRRSPAPAPAVVTAPKLPTITACTIPELGGPTNCVDGGGYFKRSTDDDEDSIVIGSKKRYSPEYYHDEVYTIDVDYPRPIFGNDEKAYTEEKRAIDSGKRSPQPKLPTIEDDTSYPVDEEWPVDEDWPVDAGYGEDESWPVDEDYEKRSLIHDPLPTGDDEGYLRRAKTKRSPMWKEGTCGPEEDAACYPDGSNGKRSPEEPAEDVGAYDEDDGVPFKRSPMWDEKTCGPEEDLACYPDGSNGKRSPTDEIQPQPLPPGAADNEHVRKRSPAPAPMYPEGTCGPEEDLACYPDGSNGKNKRALSLDSEGAPIITGDNYPPTKRERPVDTHYPGTDKGTYSAKKRAPVPTPAPMPMRPIDGDYPVRNPNTDGGGYPAKRVPAPAPIRPVDEDYPEPKDDSYPIRRDPRLPLDIGDYEPPRDDGVYDPVKREPELRLDVSDYPSPDENYPPPDKAKRAPEPQLDGDYPPLDGEYPPLDGEYPPLDGEYPPLDGEYPPLDGDYPPLDASYSLLVKPKRAPNPAPLLDAGDYGGVGIDGFYIDKEKRAPGPLLDARVYMPGN